MNRFAILALSLVSGCAVAMSATRPDPVDVQQFAVGQTRASVVSEIGSPTATVPDGPRSCDIYKLYTRGPGAVGKGALTATYAVLDVLTIGLAEAVFTPIEAATRNKLHTVTFCYDEAGILTSIKEADA